VRAAFWDTLTPPRRALTAQGWSTGRATLESFTRAIAVSHQIHTYSELRQQIHDDLRIQHPAWIEPNGECPTCDSYESRLMELLDTFTRKGSGESVADIHRVLEQGLN
jgi:hypothetical protein